MAWAWCSGSIFLATLLAGWGGVGGWGHTRDAGVRLLFNSGGAAMFLQVSRDKYDKFGRGSRCL